MQFEYDPAKSAANQEKHGLDFEDAQDLWRDPNRLLIDARSDGESRSAMIGAIEKRVWTAIFTRRDDKVRLISVRRARDTEMKLYEDNLDS